MIRGVITTKDVFRHGPLIVRGWGFRTYGRCLLALLCRRETTFLQLICGC